MKIAFLNISQGVVDRGAETFVYELAKRLSVNHRVDVISGKKISLRRWPILWRFFIDPPGVQILLFTLKTLPKIWKEKYEIVIPLNGGWQPAFVRLATWFYGGKMIISGQSGKGWDDRNNLWCFPDMFIALSTKLKNWAKRVNPFVKVAYIPNGVDTKKFKPEGKSMTFRLERPLILSVGALTAEKRLDLVIVAVSKLGKGSLVICGEGELKAHVSNLGKKLLGKRFKLVSFPYTKMPEVYRGADIFTLPSPWFRSFEIVLVEAMASGLPVVANKDDIRREIVGRAGVLVNPTNTQAYAVALENALRLKWGKRPQNQSKKFSWDIIASQYQKLFRKIKK